MSPCLPRTVPFEPGCIVRFVGSLGGSPLYSLTYWFNGRTHQATLICEVIPDLLHVMTHFDLYPDKWTEITRAAPAAL